MKRSIKKLGLNRETLRDLNLQNVPVAGGHSAPDVSLCIRCTDYVTRDSCNSCAYGTFCSITIYENEDPNA
jgi:hypothetical protein